MSGPTPASTRSFRRWSLRGMFLLTTLAAVYFALARWVPDALFHVTAILATAAALLLGRGRGWHPLVTTMAGVMTGTVAGAIAFPFLVREDLRVYEWLRLPLPVVGSMLGAIYGGCCSGVYAISVGVRRALRPNASRKS